MSSKKRSARARQREEFLASLDGTSMDDVFSHEERRRDRMDERREAALRHKACDSKQRYGSRAQAEGAIAACAEYGMTGLRCYRCTYCHGWHLTSHATAEQR
ncbi:MAG: hypothetical protein IKG18_05020 [Atopobiaceae bacterium]|nr:hypothetical protein [Atopobiaceae bacterium]